MRADRTLDTIEVHHTAGLSPRARGSNQHGYYRCLPHGPWLLGDSQGPNLRITEVCRVVPASRAMGYPWRGGRGREGTRIVGRVASAANRPAPCRFQYRDNAQDGSEALCAQGFALKRQRKKRGARGPKVIVKRYTLCVGVGSGKNRRGVYV